MGIRPLSSIPEGAAESRKRYNDVMTHSTDPESIDRLCLDLNGQTGQIGWSELQRPFARGMLIKVADGMDLVKVAARFVADDAPRLVEWLDLGCVARVSTEQAIDWQARQARFWAVVAAPWVLVQEIAQDSD